jgi:hypothetical protein
MQHLDKICATSKMNIHRKHICRPKAWCPRSPVMRVANGAYRCGPVLLSWTPRVGHSLSLVTMHSLVTPRMHGPTCCMHPCASEWPHTLSSVNPWKGQMRYPSDYNCVHLFFLVIMPRGSRFVRPDVLNQALSILDICSWGLISDTDT